MSETEKGATQTETPAVKDEKGVPWENRTKEFERKYNDLEKKVAELEARKEAQPEPERSQAEVNEEIKKELLRLAENPRKYVAEVAGELVTHQQVQRELPEAEKWLKSQEGYKPDDDTRIVQIIQENQMFHLPPKKRAETAWAILEREKLRDEIAALKSNKQREDKVSQSATEGTGKSTQTKTSPTRKELLSALKSAATKGDSAEQARLIGMLEDVRE